MTYPKISIVTVCFNEADTIESTIRSILNQTYDNIEYIVIDGGSSDGTTDIISKYANKIDKCISERDNGIYDAMNKGINLSTGDFINFMNAGDLFYDNNIVEKIVPLTTNADVIYGDWAFHSNGITTIKKAGKPSNLWKGGQLNHQSVFIKNKKDLIRYNLDYKIAADYDLFCRMFADYKWTFVHAPLVICKFDPTGISCANPQKALNEVRDISAKYFTGNVYSIKRTSSYIYKSLKNFAKKVLPQKVISLYRQYRN